MSIQDPQPPHIIVFDIETKAQAADKLLASLPPFDPEAVKVGNIKDPAKVAEKVAQAEAKHKSDYLTKAALSPATGEVCAIGLLESDGAESLLTTAQGIDEISLLNAFWAHFRAESNTRRTLWVGHNIYDFDLPYLVNRSRILGISIPPFVFEFKGGRVRWADRFIDTRTLWLMGRKPTDTPSSLDTVCGAFGLGSKSGSGADFAALLESDPAAALAYLRQDLKLTASLAQRLGVF